MGNRILVLIGAFPWIVKKQYNGHPLFEKEMAIRSP